MESLKKNWILSPHKIKYISKEKCTIIPWNIFKLFTVDNTMKLLLIIIISSIQLAKCQLIPALDNPNSLRSLGIGSNFLNSEKLKIQQGFIVGTSFMGNQSNSYGMFSNHFQFDIKSNLQMTGGVHFLQRTGNIPGPIQNQNFDVLYDLNLKYQPWENAWIKLSISNLGQVGNTRSIFQP